MSEGKTVGFEVLARSRMFGLETSVAMFSAAARLNMEVELSQMLRWEGIREALSLPTQVQIFVNTHPLELERPDLIKTMCQVRELASGLPITLEIHEAAVTNPDAMRELREQLRDLNIQVAYDDFGAGQNRLTELIESPPDVLKFDMRLIRDIDTASSEKQRMLASLTRIVLDLGVTPLAEGSKRPAKRKSVNKSVSNSPKATFTAARHRRDSTPISRLTEASPVIAEQPEIHDLSP